MMTTFGEFAKQIMLRILLISDPFYVGKSNFFKGRRILACLIALEKAISDANRHIFALCKYLTFIIFESLSMA
jgi:hypothetical protein